MMNKIIFFPKCLTGGEFGHCYKTQSIFPFFAQAAEDKNLKWLVEISKNLFVPRTKKLERLSRVRILNGQIL
jgi:hypothetical protein